MIGFIVGLVLAVIFGCVGGVLNWKEQNKTSGKNNMGSTFDDYTDRHTGDDMHETEGHGPNQNHECIVQGCKQGRL